MKFRYTLLFAIILVVLFIWWGVSSTIKEREMVIDNGVCHLETFYTIEKEGYSKAPYITGCIDKKAAFDNWCDHNEAEVCDTIGE